MSVTLKDIAKEAGVSTALVSYCLNGSKSGWMSEKTRQRIEEAARKLNYKPNRLARSLRSGRSRSIGLLTANISNPYFGHLAEEALDAAKKHDYSLIFAVIKDLKGDRGDALEFLMRNQIDALLTTPTLEGLAEEKKLLQERRIPVLRFSYPEEGALSLIDNVSSALEDACRYLQERGHRELFGYFHAPFPWNDQLEEAAKKADMKLIHRTHTSEKELGEIYQDIRERRPQAILLNGRTLYDVLNLIASMKDYEPDLIAGLDEFQLLRESPRIVGGIRTSSAVKARRGVEILIERLENPELPRTGCIPLPPGEFIRFEN